MVDFSALIPTKAFVETPGLGFCPAALSWVGTGWSAVQALWLKPAMSTARAGRTWHWETTAMGSFPVLVTVASTFTFWLVPSLQKKPNKIEVCDKHLLIQSEGGDGNSET